MNDIVQRAKTALEGTTEGAWSVVYETPDDIGGGEPYPYAIHGPADHSTLDCDWLGEEYKQQYGHEITEIVGLSDFDAEFIAQARTLVPELVAEVERLRRQKSILAEQLRNIARAISLPVGKDHDKGVADLVADNERLRSYKSLPPGMVWQDYYSPDDVCRIRAEYEAEIEQLKARETAVAEASYRTGQLDAEDPR
ncbi:hypothetical protein [Mycolicibacterium fortuitum]|uniref:hypothetical protein n=1 Tax=Mycolicibacterium fortuitum TaxID=1766 RepID=UPI002622AB88|nr:hypothetical protein [Mycolicibacterium fortuitum]